jgi:hypothetical protein
MRTGDRPGTLLHSDKSQTVQSGEGLCQGAGNRDRKIE